MDRFTLIVTALIGILSTARTARLLIFDAYPPVVWLRIKWDTHVGPEGWGKLLHCHYCLTPWVALGIALWFWAAHDTSAWYGLPAWLAVNGVWGGSYLAAILVSWDEPPAAD